MPQFAKCKIGLIKGGRKDAHVLLAGQPSLMQSLVKAWSALSKLDIFLTQSFMEPQALLFCPPPPSYSPDGPTLVTVTPVFCLLREVSPPALSWCQSHSYPMQHPCRSLSFLWTLSKPKVPLAPQSHLQDCYHCLHAFSITLMYGDGASFCM